MKGFYSIVLLTVIGGIQCKLIPTPSCGERIVVNKEPVVIDTVGIQEDCFWEITTREKLVLAFTAIDGNFEQGETFLTIHDGLRRTDKALNLKNQIVHPVSKKDLPPAVYTSSNSALVWFSAQSAKSAATPFQLKIQKAAACPFNLGIETQCGRILDPESCYCAVFTKRNWGDSKNFCTEKNMMLVALENYEEEEAIHAAWGLNSRLWTSLSDSETEGKPTWTSTSRPLYPGYANWAPGEPNGICDTSKGDEDCVLMGWNSDGAWNDGACSDINDSLCESLPME